MTLAAEVATANAPIGTLTQETDGQGKMRELIHQVSLLVL